jgi:hypothetical protein
MTQLCQLLFLLVLMGAPAYADDAIQPDKVAHFSVSAISTVTLLRLGESVSSKDKITKSNRIISSLIVAAAGLAKEIDDCQRRGDRKLDIADLRADGFGIIFGNLILIEF